eukprot:m51a1_g7985 hypothetical protein (581) ;mRNA; f:74701-76743
MLRWEGDTAVLQQQGLEFDLTEQVIRITTDDTSASTELRSLPLRRGALRGFLPAALAAHKAKQVDDGVYAAVELAVQGSARLGKQRVLAAVADALEATAPSAAAFADIARHLGGGPSVRPSLAAAAAPILEQWLGQQTGKPLGFYTWSAALEQIYRQDKLAQQPLLDLLPSGDAEALCRCVRETPAVRTAVEQNMALYARLTNPHDAPSALEPPLCLQTCLYPPSVSPEAILQERLRSEGVDPFSIDLMAEVARRVRAGTLSLRPSEESGWYAHCLWAIETLLRPRDTPEAHKLEMSDGYVDHLESLFKATMAATRETHVKQLQLISKGIRCPEPPEKVFVFTELKVEPLAEYYLRRSQAFQFVLSVLRHHFSAEELAGMHRLRESGPVAKPLVDDLEEMVLLFQGLHDIAMHELGFPRSQGHFHSDAAERAALAWIEDAENDPDLCVDNRMMVPVSYDGTTGLYKVWCVLGFTERRLVASWSKEPRRMGSGSVDVALCGRQYTAFRPVFAEAHTKRLLSRKEFQKLCDGDEDIREILQDPERLSKGILSAEALSPSKRQRLHTLRIRRRRPTIVFTNKH